MEQHTQNLISFFVEPCFVVCSKILTEVVWVEAVKTASDMLNTVSSAIERSIKQVILRKFLQKVTNNKFAPTFAEQKRGQLVARDLGYLWNAYLRGL